MRIVLDTNILVSANAKARGPARELLQLIVGSPTELEPVFSYERVRASSKLTDGEIVEYPSYLRAKDVSEIVFPGPAPRVVPADPDDDPVVHTAVVGRADALCRIVSSNRSKWDKGKLDIVFANAGVAAHPRE
jgi:predicted nucleic acid-binding protein